MAFRRVARAPDGQLKGLSQCGKHLFRRQLARPRSRELDREREPVEARAQFLNRKIRHEPWANSAGARDEECEVVVLGERRHREFVLAVDAQCVSAGHEQAQPSALPRSAPSVGAASSTCSKLSIRRSMVRSRR